jgi:hypothetical protein
MLAGAFIGGWTYYIYHKQLEVNIFKGLTDQDQGMLERARKKQHLEAFFVEIAKGMDPLLRADRRIRLIAGGEYLTRPWKDIPDLLCLLYEEHDFYNPTKVRLRQTYGLAEDVLYLLNNVFSAHDSKLLADEDYATWIAYLRDVGDHPLFLAAVYYWHDANYLGIDLAKELQKWLCRPGFDHTKATINALYREMTDDSWPQRVGQGKINCPAAGEPPADEPSSLLRLRGQVSGPVAPAEPPPPRANGKAGKSR